MAEVFLARERGLHGVERQVAIKRILPHMAEDDDFVTMFMDEARVAARLSHPNIVHIYSFGEVEGVYYLAMEFVDGLTCRQIVRRVAPEPPPAAIGLRVVADVCWALEYAHEARDSEGRPLGLVHRDVNPQNVMVSRNGVTKLLDFGVARASTQDHATRMGQLKGKVAYIAPEVFQSRQVDRRADLFAAGVLLWEVLAGRKLFKRSNEPATIHAVVSDDPPPLTGLTGIPTGVDRIIARATHKDPDRRYQGAVEMQQQLEQLIAESGLVASPFVVGPFVAKVMDKKSERDGSESDSFEPSSTTPSASSLSLPGLQDDSQSSSPSFAPPAVTPPSTSSSSPEPDEPEALPRRPMLLLFVAAAGLGTLLLVVAALIVILSTPGGDPEERSLPVIDRALPVGAPGDAGNADRR